MITCSNCVRKNSPNNKFCIYCGFQLNTDIYNQSAAFVYHKLPGSLQSPTPSETVDKTDWKLCHNCSKHIPVEEDWVCDENGVRTKAGTYTYVCPFCNHCHVGTPIPWDYLRYEFHIITCANCAQDNFSYKKFCICCGFKLDVKLQDECYECGTKFTKDVDKCPQCHFAKPWKRVNCFYCGNKQPVSLPHWIIGCDAFTLSCVRCERVSHSLCIC